MPTPSRLLVPCLALAIGLCALTTPAGADTPAMPKDSVKRAADADLKFLQTRLDDLAKKQAAGGKLLDGQIKPALGVALLLSVYGDALGDAGLKGSSLKVAETIAKKDFKEASALAKELTVKPGVPGKPAAIPKPFKEELLLEATMSPFRGRSVGGLNIDRDIRDMTKVMNPTPIDPAAVEILAVRTAVIAEFGRNLPNQQARTTPANLRLWEKWSQETVDVSKQLAEEAAKGDKADKQTLKSLLTRLNARCTDCHNREGRTGCCAE